MRTFWQTLLFWTLLSGCGHNVFSAHGYLWYFNNSFPICPNYEWAVRDSISVQRICGQGHALGCSFVGSACLIISMYDEETAKKVYLPGTDWSHWEHERIGHIQNRWSHP